MRRRPRARVAAAVGLLLAAGAALVVAGGDDGGPSGVQAGGEASSTTPDRSTGTTRVSTSSTSTSAATTEAPTTTVVVAPSVAPTAPPTTPPTGLAVARVQLTPVASLDYPIAMAVRPTDGSLWLATKGGAVCRLDGGTCTARQAVAAVSTGGEQGLLGITFNATGDRFYASYTNPQGDSRLDEFAVGAGGAPDLGTRRQILAVDQPEANHNGGNVIVGPDGRLYLGLGDGGGGGDQHGTGDGNAQDPGTDLGKILRIDPTPNPPVVERWIRGVRNPWRFSFDRATGDLWVADVGQNQWEEITYLPAGSQQGRNLGWRCYEGTHTYSACVPSGGHTGPLFEYSHQEGCSITGGYLYRGSRIPDLVGAYVFADYCSGALRALTHFGGRLLLERRLGVDPGNVVSFGQDAAGELYVLTPSAVLRVDPG